MDSKTPALKRPGTLSNGLKHGARLKTFD